MIVAVATFTIAVLGFLWKLDRGVQALHRDMRGLSDRVAKVEGLLEGLRDVISGRSGRGERR